MTCANPLTVIAACVGLVLVILSMVYAPFAYGKTFRYGSGSMIMALVEWLVISALATAILQGGC